MRVKLDPGAFMPERAHDTDAGLDLRAMEDKVVPAGGSAVFDTGVHLELPSLWVAPDSTPEFRTKTVGFIKSRSGLMMNCGVVSLGGVVDMGFTGSIRVKLYNHGTEDYHVKRGDKISQLVILPILTPSLELVDELEDTERGDGGFGSTGR